jgi:glycosyltransferase involved in cell wall biosynthesis
LKVAYLINDYPKVSHSFIRREIQSLERRGFQVQRIAVRGWKDPLPDESDQHERAKTQYVLRSGALALIASTVLALLRSPKRFSMALGLALRMAGHSDRPLAFHMAYLAEACRVAAWLRVSGACHIHAHFGTNSTEVAMLAALIGGPSYSFTVHGPEEFLRPIGLPEKIRRCSFVVAVSCFGRSQLYLWARYADWNKVKVVHCGLDRAFYADAPTTAVTAARLVCVGRLTEAKGQLLLLEAAARLAAKGVSFELVLAGDGPARSMLDALVARHGLQQRIRITGWISGAQVREEILAARALILPSFSEGLPVVIMEAMALRRPVLATYVAGIPELVRHNETGWLFPAGSVEDLCDAITDCLSRSAVELSRMGEAAYERVLARHSIDIETGKLDELLRAASP